jgi:formyl-CoA transferase
MLADPHFAAREAIVDVPHPQFGRIRMQNVVPKLSATPGGVRAPSPALGEHNDAIYLDMLGLPRERYESLKAARVI